MRCALCTGLLGAFLALPARADRIVLVAGGGDGGDGSPAFKAKLVSPFGTDFDKAGNLYFVEMTGNRVRKIDREGIVRHIFSSQLRPMKHVSEALKILGRLRG